MSSIADPRSSINLFQKQKQWGTEVKSWDGVQGGVYYLIQTMEHFWEFYENLKEQHTIAIDTETSGLDWIRAHVCGIVIGWGVEHNYYLPINHITTEPQLSIEDIREPLSKIFTDPDVIKIFWNEKFDRHFLRKSGLEVTGRRHDGVVLAHLTDENKEKKLKSRAVEKFGEIADCWEKSVNTWRNDETKRRRSKFSEFISSQLIKQRANLEPKLYEDPAVRTAGLTKAQVTARLKKMLRETYAGHKLANNKKDDVSYDYIPLDIISPYACADVHYTLLLYKDLLGQISSNDALRSLYVQEMQLSDLLFDVESKGTKIDIPYLQELEPKLTAEIEAYGKEIYDEIGGDPFKIDSNTQLVSALRKAGCNLTRLTKKGKELRKHGEELEDKHYSVDKDTLEILATEHSFASKIQHYRSKQKLLNTYVKKIQLLVDDDDYLHSSFNANVVTGRMSSYEPNCFSPDTEILTEDGWTRFDQLSKKSKVAQWDDGVVSFVEPTGYLEKGFSGNLVNITNETVDILVTPDHECLLRKDNVLKKFPANEYPEGWEQIHAGWYSSLNPNEFTVAQVDFLVAVQVCGVFTPTGELTFSVTNSLKSNRLISVLEAVGASYTHSVTSSEYFYVTESWAHWAREILGWEKNFGSWILSLSREALTSFCSEVLVWQDFRTDRYVTDSNINADWVQTAFTLSGHNYSETTDRLQFSVPYEGLVHCVSVPSGNILVRRNNCVVVTGNCQNIPGRDLSIRRAFTVPKVGGDYLYLFMDYCLTGDTEIITIDGIQTIKKVVSERTPVLSCSTAGELSFKPVTKSGKIGRAKVYRVSLDDGSSVRCTADHEWMSSPGEMVKTKDLTSGHQLMYVEDCKEKHVDWCAFLNRKVLAVVPCGEEDVYQITVDDWHTYVLANGLVSGNSQVELRLTAHHSQDPTLLAAYPHDAPAQDVHSITCAEVVMDMSLDEYMDVYGDEKHAEYKEYKWFRNIAKRVNFGIIYGAGGAAIQRQVSTPDRYVSKEACEIYIIKYFEKYPGVKKWIDNTHFALGEFGYLQNTFGRIRRLPEATSKSRQEFWKRERAGRQGVNFLIQGDAADLFKIACVRVRDLLKSRNAKTRIVSFVHDEIQLYVHKDEFALIREIKSVMEDFPQFTIPIVVDVEYSATDWGSKKALKL